MFDNYWLLPGGLYTTTSPIPGEQFDGDLIFTFTCEINVLSMSIVMITLPVTAFPQQKARMCPSSLVEINLLKKDDPESEEMILHF